MSLFLKPIPPILTWLCNNQNNSCQILCTKTSCVIPTAGVDNLICRCEPPPGDFFKINWDAAINNSLEKVSIGIIARDSENSLWLQKECKMNFSLIHYWPNPLEILKQQFFVMYLVGLRRIILKGDDSLQAVHSITQPDTCWTSVGMLITNVKNRLDNLIVGLPKLQRSEMTH